ncbi:MAG: aminopeptidase P family protein [Erysipelotrichaceae bacterium]|nr:aminopeptidase P family protein [Erysipelotrichaceae bacterium]
MINQRIHQLRELMEKEKIDLYVIPTADDHQSEYISDYYKTRVFMSGFTGSAGTMVVTQKHAALWADGRYHVQAEQQLKGTCVELFKMGLEGVPTVLQMIEQWTCKGSVLGFDGKTMSAALGRELEHIAERKQASLAFDQDLVDVIWEDRPALPSGKVWPLAVQYSGTDRNEKLKELREDMLQVKADVHVLSALDEIAWLMNLRGSDVAHTPVFLSFMIIDQKNCTLYINRTKIEAELKAEMEQQNIYLKEYDEFMSDLEQIKNQRIWCDSLKCHYAMVKTMKTHNDILDQPSSIVLKKACKNDIELSNLRKAHEKDGAAFTKFMIWLKNSVKDQKITEISASEKLAQIRKEMGAIDLSFDTIAAYNEHGAMMHYSATAASDAVLEKGLFLVDSGGQYLEGTTDITRTMVIQDIPPKWKMYCTVVLKSMLALSRAKFLYGCSGLSLDILAREPIWELDLDYQCGTGHGVGYLLSVHEGPQAFRWHVSSGRHEDTKLEEGMILTNEPGLYFEGEFGVRLENELIVRKGVNNMYGQFMEFETMTYAPIDLELLDVCLLTEREKNQLNKYHAEVYMKLEPYMNEEEKKVLKELTRAV